MISFSEIQQENLKGELFLSKRELSPASEKDPILICSSETKNEKKKRLTSHCCMHKKSLFSFVIYIGNIRSYSTISRRHHRLKLRMRIQNCWKHVVWKLRKREENIMQILMVTQVLLLKNTYVTFFNILIMLQTSYLRNLINLKFSNLLFYV